MTLRVSSRVVGADGELLTVVVRVDKVQQAPPCLGVSQQGQWARQTPRTSSGTGRQEGQRRTWTLQGRQVEGKDMQWEKSVGCVRVTERVHTNGRSWPNAAST